MRRVLLSLCLGVSALLLWSGDAMADTGGAVITDEGGADVEATLSGSASGGGGGGGASESDCYYRPIVRTTTSPSSTSMGRRSLPTGLDSGTSDGVVRCSSARSTSVRLIPLLFSSMRVADSTSLLHSLSSARPTSSSSTSRHGCGSTLRNGPLAGRAPACRGSSSPSSPLPRWRSGRWATGRHCPAGRAPHTTRRCPSRTRAPTARTSTSARRHISRDSPTPPRSRFAGASHGPSPARLVADRSERSTGRPPSPFR